MYAKAHNTPDGPLVAACDATLLGKKFRDGNAVLDLETHANFYRGERMDEETLCKLLLQTANANLVGEKAVGCAMRLGLAKKSDIRRINSVPHLVIFRI